MAQAAKLNKEESDRVDAFSLMEPVGKLAAYPEAVSRVSARCARGNEAGELAVARRRDIDDDRGDA